MIDASVRRSGDRLVGGLSLAACIALAACGGSAGEAAEPAQPVDQQPVTSADPEPSAAPEADGPGSGTVVATAPPTKGKAAATKTPTAAKPKKPNKFTPKVPASKLAKFLRKPGADALKQRDYGRAIPIFRALVSAVGPGDKAQYHLATAWILAGKQRQALDALELFIATTSDAATKKKAKAQYARQKRRKVRFGDQNFNLKASPKLAKQAFERGRRAFKSKLYADALVYYKMGSSLAPDAAGFLREIGAAYAKLGAKKEKTKWYLSYLRKRPFGKNATLIRKQLRKEKGVLGKVNITSPFKCEFFVIEQPHKNAPKPPIKNLSLAPGKYTSFCGNEKYAMGYWEDFTVEAGKTKNVKLSWAVLVNGLKSPYGRIIVENAREPGVMMDLGITKTEYGIYVPRDRRALRVILKADDESRVEERMIRVEAGGKEVVKW